jgi:hypothetical protein
MAPIDDKNHNRTIKLKEQHNIDQAFSLQASTYKKEIMSLQQEQQEEQKDSSKPKDEKVVAATQPKKKKRKRKPNSEEDDAILILKLQQERYDKLLYTAKKQIHKHAKICKTFLVQKCVRSLKKQQEQNSSNNSKLEGWKELNLDLVVEQAIRQLGLLHANPNPETSMETMSMSSPTTDPLVTTLLQHTRFKSVLEEWNQKVTEYRRWCLQWNERNDKFAEPKSKKTMKEPPKQQPMSMFCSLGGGEKKEKDLSAYGPAADYAEEPKKKNRQGQRGRRAKAMAIEAKKQGRGREHREQQSLNWRSGGGGRKEKQEEGNGGGYEGGDKKKDAPPKEPEVQHPSWVAKQQQSSGIVAFQGTKITFD